jgi:hypothetical protein
MKLFVTGASGYIGPGTLIGIARNPQKLSSCWFAVP